MKKLSQFWSRNAQSRNNKKIRSEGFITAPMSVFMVKPFFVVGEDHKKPFFVVLSFHLPSNLFAARGEGGRIQIGRQVEGFSLFGCAAAGVRGIQYK